MLISLNLKLCPGQSSNCKIEQKAITPKLGQTELRFFSTALLFNELYPSTKFHVDISYSFRVISRTKFKVLIWPKGNNFKIRQDRVMVLFALHFHSMRFIYLKSFMLISFIVLELCPEQRFQSVQMYKWTKVTYLKTRQNRLMAGSLALHFHPIRFIFLHSFMLISLIVLELFPGQTAHLLNEIYLPTKFYVDTSCCFKVMSRT
jgi:hypothetical protein